MAQADIDARWLTPDEQPGRQEPLRTQCSMDDRLTVCQVQKNVQTVNETAPGGHQAGLPEDPFRRAEEADGVNTVAPLPDVKRHRSRECLCNAGPCGLPGRAVRSFLFRKHPAIRHPAGRLRAFPTQADPDPFPAPLTLRGRLHGGLPGGLLDRPEHPQGAVRVSGRTNEFLLLPMEDLVQKPGVPALSPVRRVPPVDDIVPHKGQGSPPPSRQGFL